ncbi:hypothetical protein D3C80_2015110 [compost metagenome]
MAASCLARTSAGMHGGMPGGEPLRHRRERTGEGTVGFVHIEDAAADQVAQRLGERRYVHGQAMAIKGADRQWQAMEHAVRA